MERVKLTRDERRQRAIRFRGKRQQEMALKLSLMPEVLKKRHVRRYGHSKTRARLAELARTFEVMPAKEHTGKLKVLFLSVSDYAFLGYTLAECLKSVDIEAVAVAAKLSPLWPSKQGRIYNKDEVLDLAQEAYVVVWMHSLLTPLPAQVLRGTRCVVFHGGTRYRRNPARINKVFNERVHLSLVQTGELLGKGAKNEHWLLPPVDTVGLKPHYSFENENKLIIGHFSSHVGGKGHKALVKGSSLIESVIGQLKQSEWKSNFIFRKATTKQMIPWKENIKRMAQCDIYVESLSHAQPHNKNRHDWSIQALEACSLGCITVTNFLFEDQYQRMYGDHGLIVVNTRQALVKALTDLFQKDRDELLELKHKARSWVEEKHSYEAVGKRLRTILKL